MENNNYRSNFNVNTIEQNVIFKFEIPFNGINK